MTPPTLPGDLPGLLRKGSPVVTVLGSHAGVAHDATSAIVVVCTTSYALHEVCLDLSDPTGRAHAAWWWGTHAAADGDGYYRDAEAHFLVTMARRGDDMTPDEIDTLRRACLAVAGR